MKRRLILTFVVLMLAVLCVGASAKENTVEVTFGGETYSVTYNNETFPSTDGLWLMMHGDRLPIVDGLPQAPFMAAIDVRGVRLTAYRVSINSNNGAVDYGFLFYTDIEPDTVWLYPGGEEENAVQIWPAVPSKEPEVEQAFETMTLGQYEQDNDPSNGAEAIEWLVLSSDGETATLISRYGLDCVRYDNEDFYVTWETSSLRQWLNDDFLNAAFTDGERARLETVTVAADPNPMYKNDPGQDTLDRVFLLSRTEAEACFLSDKARICEPTAYAEAQGVKASREGACSWWLRTPGQKGNLMMDVYSSGAISTEIGDYISNNFDAVRPVIVVRLSGEAEPPAEPEPPQPYDVGQIVSLGQYEQDNDPSNGAEPIEWLVLANDGDSVTLISRCALERLRFNEEYTDIAWETCTLRQWLNNDFLNAAFSDEERARLVTTTVTADSNPDHLEIDPGNDTEDRVFLLSMDEAEAYFASCKARGCYPTPYVEGQEEYIKNSDSAWWWLRTPGYKSDHIANVTQFGDINELGFECTYDNLLVRPAVVLWISDPADMPVPPVVYLTLQKGDRSDDVVRLQQALIDGGYLSGKADGDFGKMTETAVKAAQEALGLEATGMADDALQKRLYGE